jgi:hypothetical protein
MVKLFDKTGRFTCFAGYPQGGDKEFSIMLILLPVTMMGGTFGQPVSEKG